MPELTFPTVLILAPPFLSHFQPLAALGEALSRMGVQVTVGCTAEFQSDVEDLGLRFVEVAINKNSNRGVATETEQEGAERQRLLEFRDATREGPIETLIVQSRHRSRDMLANPVELIATIRELSERENPSLWIVDQLSYGATLALYGLGAPYATFCAPHPASIPDKSMIYGVPPKWPTVLQPSPQDLERLRSFAADAEVSFTAQFNSLLDEYFHLPPVASAFALHSPHLVLYNYPPFVPTQGSADSAKRVFAGHSFREEPLDPEWRRRLEGSAMRVLVAFGTFLASRTDVLIKVIRGVQAAHPEARIFVGAGDSLPELESIAGATVFPDRFVPQRGLLPHMDLVVHHGGVSSFTETLFAGKPMIVMPFSSDQFSVARDVEDQELGVVLDPNGVSVRGIAAATEHARTTRVIESIAHWSEVIRARGPQYAAAQIEESEGPI